MIRRTAVLLVLLFTFHGSASGEPAALREGGWGLEFQVQPSIFGPSGSAGIGLKRFFTDRSAVRLSLMAGINSQDSDEIRRTDRAFPYDTVQVASTVASYSDGRDVTLSLHLARYLDVGSRFAMTLEAGPMVRWSSTESGYTETYPAPRGVYTSASDRDAWEYGADVQAGFEWFFRNRLSLSARYGVTALRLESRTSSRFDFTNVNDGAWDRRVDDGRADGFSVRTTSTSLSLTAYW